MSTFWIRTFALSSLAAFCLLCPSPSVRPAAAAPPSGYTLVWSDEFDEANGQLDTSKWGHFMLGLPFYYGLNVSDAVTLDGSGHLVITTYTENGVNKTGMIATGEDAYTGSDQPGHLTPRGDKRVGRYGYLEAKVQFVGGPGVWSSFWMQSRTYGVPVDTPRVAGTEIDIMEHLYNSSWGTSNLHWDGYCDPQNPQRPGRSAGTGHQEGGLQSGFHTFGVEWTPDVQRFYWDDVLKWTVTNSSLTDPPSQVACGAGAPVNSLFDGPVSRANEYVILDNEVRDSVYNYGSKGDANNAKMIVDYVQWYEPLPAPSGLTATTVSWSQINLAWTDNSYAEDNYKVERSLDNVNFSQVATLAANAQSYQDTGLGNGTRYYYRVRASAGAGNGAYSTTANATTFDVVPPANVTDLWVPSVGNHTMAVAWSSPGDDGFTGRATQYDLRYSTSQITAANFNSATQLTTSAPRVAGSVECYRASNLSACTTYWFAVKTKDDAGNWSIAISNPAHGKTECTQNIVADCVSGPDEIPPKAISNLSVWSAGTTTMALNWTAPGDDSTFGTAVQYDLRYSTSSIDAGTFASATPFTIAPPRTAGSSECRIVSGLLGCRTYYFAIKTKDDAGNWSAISNLPVTGTTVCGQNTVAYCGEGAPQAPVPVGEASLSFSRPYPNPARGATSFRITIPGNVQGAKLRVEVFDVAGRRVRSLVDRIASQGTAQVEWNLLNNSGRRVASGMYLMRVAVGDTRKTFPLLVLR